MIKMIKFDSSRLLKRLKTGYNCFNKLIRVFSTCDEQIYSLVKKLSIDLLFNIYKVFVNIKTPLYYTFHPSAMLPIIIHL